jgi:hypothetical protein
MATSLTGKLNQLPQKRRQQIQARAAQLIAQEYD